MSIDIGFIHLNFALLQGFLSQGAASVAYQLYIVGGWIVLVWLLLVGGIRFYVELLQKKNTDTWKFVLLAIDIPQLNVQTPKAVEQMFAHLAGALNRPDLREKFREGFKQRWFSFEIVSIEGYIQFLVWTEEKFRDLVEASVYAQYPDVQITEVEDYVGRIPDRFPNDEYEIFGADFTLAEDTAYPIRTYREFEHSISKDTVLKDPMGTFLESFTRIGHGEQMWFQILVEPVGNEWKEKAIQKIKEIIGDSSTKTHKAGALDVLSGSVTGMFNIINDELFARPFGGSVEGSSAHNTERPAEPNQLKYLTPGQSKTVEAMEEKMAKIGFKTKMRAFYIARKEVYNPVRGVNALVGAINQFNIPTANSIVPKIKTNVRGLHKQIRIKNAMLKAYKKRKIVYGTNPFILNIEELATIWHFPMSHVKTPMVQKAASKMAEPPAGLPVETAFDEPVKKEPEEKGQKPSYTADTGEEVFFDDFA